MQFRNLTPFPALAFEGIDQHQQAFHVVVLRQTLSYAGGVLDYADDQAPLCEVDEFHGEMNASSLRQESDLCHYKPKCDVLVDGAAHAPGGRPAPRWHARLQVRAPREAPEVPPPHGLNPLQGPTPEQWAAWRAEVERLRAQASAGAILFDKTLAVTGPRRLRRGRLGGYVLTEPTPVTVVPLRDELAYGGRCRITADDPAASHVPSEVRPSEAERGQHPEAPASPIADRVCAANPVGIGFAEGWYLNALKPGELPAPQIEHPAYPLSAALLVGGKADAPALRPWGFGVRPNGHPERVRLAGTLDAAFAESDRWLPEDFDFAVWNAAWPDQQIEHLQGDETFLLANMSPPGSPCVAPDGQGNGVLRLTLPGHECYVLIQMANGIIAAQPLVIDTVLIEPEHSRVTLVWRGVLDKTPDAPIALLEARLRSREAKAHDNDGRRLDRAASAQRLTRRILAQALEQASDMRSTKEPAGA